MKYKICITKLARRDFGFEITPAEGELSTRIRVEMPLPLVICGLALAVAPEIFGRLFLARTKLYVNDEVIDLLTIAQALPLLKSVFDILKDGKKNLGRNIFKAGAERTFNKVLEGGNAVKDLLVKFGKKFRK